MPRLIWSPSALIDVQRLYRFLALKDAGACQSLPTDRLRSDDLAAFDVGFVVAVDVVQVIEVVHHEAVRLLEAFFRDVAKEVQLV